MIAVEERMILVNLLNEKGEYEMQKPVMEGQMLSPRDFPEIKIDVEELFKDVKEEE